MDLNLLLMNSASASKGAGSSSWLSIVMLLGLFAVMYFFMIRPQKKQEKADAEMRNALEIGDEIVTVGGIVGKVVTLREEEIIIETGTDRTKIKITRTAIYQNKTANNKVAEQRQAKVEAAKAAKEAKKSPKKEESKEDSFEEK